MNLNAKDNYENPPLLEAIYKGDITKVQTLVDKGADVNAKDEAGFTVLIVAAREAWRGNIAIVKALIEAGANVNARNGYGDTALHLATMGGHTDIVQALIEAGADKHVRDKKTRLDGLQVCHYGWLNGNSSPNTGSIRSRRLVETGDALLSLDWPPGV